MKSNALAAVAAAALPWVGLVAAAPSNSFEVAVLGGSTMRLTQMYNKNFKMQQRGPRELAKAYHKFGIAYPDNLRQVLERIIAELGLSLPKMNGGKADGNDTADSGQGEVQALPEMFDSEYLAMVQIGTPPQEIMLNFDTGSSDLWVFSSQTPANQVNGQKLYNITSSSTSKLLDNSTWSIRYGDGSRSSGVVYTDTVSIGGVTVENQAVEAANMVSPSFTMDAASSGLVGLAFSHINQVVPNQQKTFFDNAMQSLAMPLFSANLKRGEAGNYNFGFIDSTEFDGDLTFVPVNNTDGFWKITSTGYTIGTGQEVPGNLDAIADTGTTLMLLPPELVEAYYKAVPSAQNNPQVGGYVYSCSEKLPDFTVSIGTYKAVVPGTVINYAPADTDSFDTAKICFGGIQTSTGLPFAIFGDIFLKAQFAVFHGGNKQLGLAPKPQAAPQPGQP